MTASNENAMPGMPGMPGMPAKPRRMTISTPAAILWACAFLLAALVVMQAGRLPGNPAYAETAAVSNGYTLLTVDAGKGGDVDPWELLYVLDSREEVLLVYEIEDARRKQIILRGEPTRLVQERPTLIIAEQPALRCDPGRALATEWLLTNGLGDFAMGTAIGANTRRYHGLLIAAASPPIARVVALHSIAEQLVLQDEVIDLSTHQFGTEAQLHPGGWRWLVRFDVDPPWRCTWEHRVRGIRFVRSLELDRYAHRARVEYRIFDAPPGAVFRARPFAPLRDFHSLDHERGDPPAHASPEVSGFGVQRGKLSFHASCESARWRDEPQWWRDFAYVEERARGQDWIEDLWSPGAFEVEIGETPRFEWHVDVAIAGASAPEHESAPAAPAGAVSETRKRLRVAADQFVVRRACAGGWATTILAGYPWFSDWGRDSMISIPGLLLESGRFDEARSLLRLFMDHRRGGLIPNRFPDVEGDVDYNTVDAGLWFLQAVYAYARASGDRDLGDMLDASLDVVSSYRAGAGYGIVVDDDGLVRSGDGTIPVTWMDAKRGGISFTPRDGKPVEISALWHSGLLALAELLEESGDRRRAAPLREMAARTAESIRSQFWWPQRGCLYDVLVEDGGAWRPDASLRPNQVFAVSLPYSPLTAEQQRGVVAAVRDHLLTPYGLRTLEPAAPGYIGRYEGDLMSRDAAYHNGTVWPWLIGPYCEALLRVEGDGPETLATISTVLQPLVASLDEDCLHQVAEVYDGDEPQRASGCPAQAWSVAELLRILAIVE